MRVKVRGGLLAVLAVLVTCTSFAEDPATRVAGEVVEIDRTAAADGSAALERITVRTRSGELRSLLLGEPGSCAGCVAVGDRIRARVMAGSPGNGAQLVRTLRVRNTGESFAIRDEAGTPRAPACSRAAGPVPHPQALPGITRASSHAREAEPAAVVVLEADTAEHGAFGLPWAR